MRVKDAEEYPVLISRRSLYVLCASMISTYGVMSSFNNFKEQSVSDMEVKFSLFPLLFREHVSRAGAFLCSMIWVRVPSLEQNNYEIWSLLWL